MSENLTLGGSPLSLEDVERVARAGARVTLDPAARARIRRRRPPRDEQVARGGRL